MMSLGVSFVLIKINTLILMGIFLYGYKSKRLDTTEMLILVTMLVSVISSQVITQKTDFYTYYLSFASNILMVITVSIFLHILWQEMHSKLTYFIYGILFVQFLSHMLLHRVRTQIYNSDEPIMWLINGQSMVIIACNVLIIFVLILRVSEWNPRYMHSV